MPGPPWVQTEVLSVCAFVLMRFIWSTTEGSAETVSEPAGFSCAPIPPKSCDSCCRAATSSAVGGIVWSVCISAGDSVVTFVGTGGLLRSQYTTVLAGAFSSHWIFSTIASATAVIGPTAATLFSTGATSVARAVCASVACPLAAFIKAVFGDSLADSVFAAVVQKFARSVRFIDAAFAEAPIASHPDWYISISLALSEPDAPIVAALWYIEELETPK